MAAEGTRGTHADVTDRKQAEEALAREAALTKSVIDSIPGTFYVLDERGNYARWNDYQRDEIVGKPDDQMANTNAAVTIHPDDGAFVQEKIVNVLSTGADETIEGRVLMRGGPAFKWLLMTGRRMIVDEKPYLVGIGIDITDRKQAEEALRDMNALLERRVRERTAALEEMNKELETFSYSVSHDLRAPLRAIEGFSSMLTTEHAESLDLEGLRLLGVVRTNVRKMTKLIEDLLAFSKTGRIEMHRSTVNMGKLAQSVFEEVPGDPAARAKIRFTMGELPDVDGDPALLRQVWINLLSNAVKFTRKHEAPEIRIEGSLAVNDAVYSVRDNGAGFDMAHAGKLFGVFQRLHAVTEFEGTGIGLSIVQRIITRHGGRVWAEGKEGEGATFSFALPVKQPEG